MTSPPSGGTNWPFADPPDTAVFTVGAVLSGAPVLHVQHDEEDGAWQFLDGSDVSYTKARVVSLAEIVGLDPSVADVADLSLGWQATRDAPHQAWVREPQPPV